MQQLVCCPWGMVTDKPISTTETRAPLPFGLATYYHIFKLADCFHGWKVAAKRRETMHVWRVSIG